jgi:hypothetical protein
VIEVTEVRTHDAHPVDAPHTVSDQPGHSTAQVLVTAAGAGPIRAWRVEPNPQRRDHPPVRVGGCVTGLDRCGTRTLLSTPSPFALAFTILRSELGGPGDYPFDVHAETAEDGWL